MHPAGEHFELYELDDDASLAALNDGHGPTCAEWLEWLGQLQQLLGGDDAEQWLAWTEHPGRRSIREQYVRTYFQRPAHTVAAHRGSPRELWPLPHHDDDALQTLGLTAPEWDHYLGQLGRALAAGRRSAEWLDDPRRAGLKARYLATVAQTDAGAEAEPATAPLAGSDRTPAPSGAIGRLGTGWRSPRQHDLATSPRTMRSGARSVTGAGRGLRRVINSADPVEARKPPAATFHEGYRVQYVAALREGARRWF